MISCDLFIFILQRFFTGTGACPSASEAILKDMAKINEIHQILNVNGVHISTVSTGRTLCTHDSGPPSGPWTVNILLQVHYAGI